MGRLYIEIKKTEENERKVTYSFEEHHLPKKSFGKVVIDKKSGEFFVLEEPEWDINHTLAVKTGLKLEQHWKKGEFPDVTCWVS